MKTYMTPAGNTLRAIIATNKALNAACRRLMRTCPVDVKCPIMRRECMTGVPTRKSCAERMKALLLRRAR